MSEVVRLYRYKSLLSDRRAVSAEDLMAALESDAPKAWAMLKFSPERARWVAGEVWHPLQESKTEADGSYVLSFPYSDDRELLGDIIRFGADVEVLVPPDLRSRIKRALHAAAGRYV